MASMTLLVKSWSFLAETMRIVNADTRSAYKGIPQVPVVQLAVLAAELPSDCDRDAKRDIRFRTLRL